MTHCLRKGALDTKDTLTTRDHIQTSVRKIIETSLSSLANNWKLSTLDEETQQQLLEYIFGEAEWGHDTVFLEDDAQAILLEEIARVTARKESEKQREGMAVRHKVRQAIAYLQSIDVPIEVNIIKSTNFDATQPDLSSREWENLLRRLNEVIKVKVWEIVATYVSAIDPEKSTYEDAFNFIIGTFLSIPFVEDTFERNRSKIIDTSDPLLDKLHFVVSMFFEPRFDIDLKPRLEAKMDSRSKAYFDLSDILSALYTNNHQKLQDLLTDEKKDFLDNFLDQLQTTRSAQLDLSLEELLQMDRSLVL